MVLLATRQGGGGTAPEGAAYVCIQGPAISTTSMPNAHQHHLRACSISQQTLPRPTPRTFMVASMMSSSDRPIHFSAGANTSSSMDLGEGREGKER